MDIICCYSWADTVWIFIKPACCFKGPICKKSGCLSLIPNSLNTVMTGMTLWVSHLVENWRFGIVGWISRHPKASVYDELGMRLSFFTNRTFNLHYTISMCLSARPEPTTFSKQDNCFITNYCLLAALVSLDLNKTSDVPEIRLIVWQAQRFSTSCQTKTNYQVGRWWLIQGSNLSTQLKPPPDF